MAVFGSKPALFLLAACRPPQRMWADIPVECVDPGVVVRPDERSPLGFSPAEAVERWNGWQPTTVQWLPDPSGFTARPPSNDTPFWIRASLLPAAAATFVEPTQTGCSRKTFLRLHLALDVSVDGVLSAQGEADVVATDGPPWTWVVTGILPAELAPGGRAWFPEAPPAAWAQLALISHMQGTREPDLFLRTRWMVGREEAGDELQGVRVWPDGPQVPPLEPCPPEAPWCRSTE